MVIGQKELTVVHTQKAFFRSTELHLYVNTHCTYAFDRCTPAFCSMTQHSENAALKLKVKFLTLFLIIKRVT